MPLKEDSQLTYSKRRGKPGHGAQEKAPVLDRKEKQDGGEGIRLSLSKSAFFGIAFLWD